MFSFDVRWVPGKTHLIADALSRAPLFSAEDLPGLEIDTAISCLSQTSQPSIRLSITLSMTTIDNWCKTSSIIPPLIYLSLFNTLLKHMQDPNPMVPSIPRHARWDLCVFSESTTLGS